MTYLSEQFQQIDELLKSARRILIASHENPDPDAVSSVLTIHNILKSEGFETLPYLPNPAPKSLNYLPGFFEIKQQVDNFEPDVLIALDYGDFKRLRLPDRILNKSPLDIITIDHHVKSDQKGKIKIVEPEFSSTSEIVYHWLKYKNIEINKDIALCLLSGIISDSGGFRHVSTSSETLNIVSKLLSVGVSLNKITRQTLTLDSPLNFSKAWGKVLSRAKLDEKTNLAYSWIDSDDLNKYKVSLADFDGITNLISTSSPVNLGLFMVEHEKGKIKGSLRSEPYKGRDVVKIAKALGGGGHPYAAGFQQEGTIEETLKKVINLIE
ncbi:MAG: bifunctional oligoribonuclease/PAP phosphatase NrnA [Candidatus Nealsonbacteria bacterium]|nr:bifunctional oligoribonuclease/PAP phosphatase NrnA [Candidatus Nealsonbacteria bacterium]